ncbi:MAG: helix-turn-helix transcriptional regulator [Flavobacteriales bacterium]|nr:helix-turn-helix transcriptional regulator [Flavobacteriales bacterium]
METNIPISKEEGNTQERSPIRYTINQIGGNWKSIILWSIKFKLNRFSLLLKELPISRKMLSKELKDLERNGIIKRTSYPEVPPRVEYSLTEKGKSLSPLLGLMNIWGEQNMNGETN